MQGGLLCVGESLKENQGPAAQPDPFYSVQALRLLATTLRGISMTGFLEENSEGTGLLLPFSR